MIDFDLGTAIIEPREALVAGAYTSLTYTYTAGHPVDDSGYLKIAFRFAGDFGTPQFELPEEANYCTVATTANCVIEPRWDPKGHTRPWGKALFLKITKGFLGTGEKIIVKFGDMEKGSLGWKAQTFREYSFEFKTLVDPIATYSFKELPESPVIEILPGEPAKAVCMTPSMLETNEKFKYYLKLEDKWGNPVDKPKELSHDGFAEAGTEYLEVRDEKSGLMALGGPISVVETLPAQKPFWADFHGQTEETIGSNAIEDYLTFARDYAKLDISGHQGNDFQVTDEFWEKVKRISNEFNESGEFVVYPGYEWSGNTPLGGDRNIYFASGEGDILRSCFDLLPGQTSKYDEAPNADILFKGLGKQSSELPFSFAHVGGRYADLTSHDPDIEVAVEIHSAWGTFEWLLEDAFKLGYRIGVCANSDGHKCRPGASYPGASRFGSYGGLTCVLATQLDRQSIYEAMKARRFYGTTGHRPIIDLQVSSSEGRSADIGGVLETSSDSVKLNFRVAGTSAIESVDIFNGLEHVKTIRGYAEEDLGRVLKVMWSGAEVRGRSRQVLWDGSLSVEDNSILEIIPINFWNPDNVLQQLDATRLEWSSITTGGHSGCILKLNSSAGALKINTSQGDMTCEISTLGLEGKVLEFGGVKKRLSAYRLPDVLNAKELAFELEISNLKENDNPIYVRVNQVDGHQAWTSPVYVVK